MRMMKVSALNGQGDLIEGSHEKYIDIDRIHELFSLMSVHTGMVYRQATISGREHELTEEDYNRIKGILSNKFV
jgi:hypothetical protein